MDSHSSPVIARTLLDPEMLAAAIRNADLQALQLSRQPAESRLARVMCPNASLDFSSFGPAMLFSGGMPADCYTLSFARKLRGNGHSFNFGAEHGDGYLGFFPPGGPLDAMVPAGSDIATLTVSEAAFHDALGLHFPEMPDAILARGAGMRIGSLELAGLHSILSMIEDAIWQPEGSRELPLICRRLEGELLGAFLSALRSGCGDLVSPPTPRLSDRYRRFRLARDFVIENAAEPIDLGDICAEVGLGRRGVEKMFHDLLGVGPNTFLRHRRLHSARCRLKQAEPASGQVKKIARELGFWHLGHFAHHYRSLFNESPVVTLKRAAGG